MKTWKYIVPIATLLMLVACQNDDLVPSDFASDPRAVRIHATVGDLSTRSNPIADDKSDRERFNEGDQISIGTGGADAQEPVVYTLTNGVWTPAAGKYLVWKTDAELFEAHYPAGESFDGSNNFTLPADQSSPEILARADYMTFEGRVEKLEDASLHLTLMRQTARVVVSSKILWNAQYQVGGKPTHRVTHLALNCNGVSDIQPCVVGNYYALVVPGKARAEAPFITVTVAPLEGDEAPVTYTIPGIPAFEAGHSYTYHLSIGQDGASIGDVTVEDWQSGSILGSEGRADDEVEPYLYVQKPEGNFSAVGGTKEYTVRSFITNSVGEQIGLPWTAKFVRKLEDGTYEEIQQGDADYPTWITGFVDRGNGSAPDQVCSITVEAAEISNAHYYALKNNAPVSGTYNLAHATGGEAVENTANCYIVNAPGTYSFPLVYGNAIKNGADNRSAYISTATGNYALETFVNHNNAPITSPYIANHEGCIPADATLVWQDAENLVSNIRFVDGGSPEAHRITFEVASSSIKQGNAIIAVRNAEGTILWSWHIWVTDYKPLLESTVTASYDPTETQRDKKVWTYDNKKSYIHMGVPLGWCDAESATGREVIIQYTQAEMGNTYEVTIKQEPLSAGGNCTYYQWGRKDPMLPSNGLGNVDKPHSGNYTFTKAQGKVTLGTAIQKPHEVYDSGPSGWSEWYSAQSTVAGKDFFQNLWDANDCSTGDRYNIGIKTVYDPSPVGYIVPPSDAINSFTYDGKSAGREDETSDWDKSYTDKFNSVEKTRAEVDAIKGMTFYCKGMNGALNTYNKDGGVIYFPVVGTRDEYYGNELDRVGVRGNYWTTAQTGSGQARTFLIDFDLIYVLTQGKINTSLSLAVRPIREQ